MSHLDILNERMISELADMLERKQIREIRPGIPYFTVEFGG